MNDIERPTLDATPEFDSVNSGFANGNNKRKINTKGLTLRQKLETLNELLVDACIENLDSGKIKPNDLGAIVTLLKNNKVVEEKREISEADLIDDLIEDKK